MGRNMVQNKLCWCSTFSACWAQPPAFASKQHPGHTWMMQSPFLKSLRTQWINSFQNVDIGLKIEDTKSILGFWGTKKFSTLFIPDSRCLEELSDCQSNKTNTSMSPGDYTVCAQVIGIVELQLQWGLQVPLILILPDNSPQTNRCREKKGGTLERSGSSFRSMMTLSSFELPACKQLPSRSAS